MEIELFSDVLSWNFIKFFGKNQYFMEFLSIFWGGFFRNLWMKYPSAHVFITASQNSNSISFLEPTKMMPWVILVFFYKMAFKFGICSVKQNQDD